MVEEVWLCICVLVTSVFSEDLKLLILNIVMEGNFERFSVDGGTDSDVDGTTTSPGSWPSLERTNATLLKLESALRLLRLRRSA